MVWPELLEIITRRPALAVGRQNDPLATEVAACTTGLTIAVHVACVLAAPAVWFAENAIWFIWLMADASALPSTRRKPGSGTVRAAIAKPMPCAMIAPS